MTLDGSRTDWTRIRGGDFDFFVARYWNPVHRYLAARLPTREEAEDVTQELFLTFLEKDFLARADAGRGSFRNFLFHAARQFLVDWYRTRSAAKRGEDRQVSLEAVGSSAGGEAEEAPDAFDREWYVSLFNRARRAVKEHYAALGHEEVYRAFRLFHFGDGSGEEWPQKRIAETLGVNLQSVKNWVHRAKDVFSREIRKAVTEYARSDEEVESELADLGRFLEKHRLLGPPSSSAPGGDAGEF